MGQPTCARCAATFAGLMSGCLPEQRAATLDASEPYCRCEGFTVSPLSPGPVTDDEELIRVLVAPQHRAKKGGAKAAALTHAETKGLSLLRKAYATDEEILAVASELVVPARAAGRTDTAVFGVLIVRCGDVRAIRDAVPDPACFCVYDTAEPERLSHAECFQRVGSADLSLREKRRITLFDSVRNGFVPVDDFRGGLLRGFAAPQT